MKQHVLAFVDLETTSLNPFDGEILEIGIVLAAQERDSEGVQSLKLLSEHVIQLLPEHIETADPKSLEVCKYALRDWSSAVTQKEGLTQTRALIEGSIFVAQNVSFDWGFLLYAGHQHGINFDTCVHYHKLDLASMVFGSHYHDTGLHKFSLREMTEYFGVVNQNAHTALADARATFEVCKKLLSSTHRA